MKKLFSLVMFALLAVGTNAQTWKATSTKPDAGAALVDNDLVKVETVYETTAGSQSVTIDGKSFTGYIQLRTAGTASESQPDGGEQSGSTPLIVTAKKNIDVTFYFRRQYDSNNNNSLEIEDGKDLLCWDQINSSKYTTATEQTWDIDGSNAYAKKTYRFVAGGIYTMYRNGSTMRVYGIDVIGADPATAPAFNPEGGNVMAFSTITLTSDGTVYYQWSDEATAPATSAENWTKGTSVTVPNEIGTKYLHAYATNGEGLESAVVSQAYNITEFTLTAVTNKTWTFTTDGGWPEETLASGDVICRDNMIVTGDIKFDGKVLPLPGAGSATSRNVQFMVAPQSRITIKCVANNAGRTLKIDSNTFGNTIGTISVPTTAAEYSIDYIDTEEATIIVYSAGSGINLNSIKVEPLPTETKKVTEAGWATYIPKSNALFEDGNAYVVTAVNAANVEIKGVTAVPAGTPVLLKEEGEKTITLTTATIEAPEKNLLEVYDGEQAGKVAYVLAKDEVNGAGFKKWTGDESVLTGRAVLWLDETQTARGFFALDGEATGIKAVATSVEDGTIYDLQGRRVAQPKSGLYIVNGKKVVVK